VRNKGENKIPAILALGFIAGHNPSLSFTTIYSKGIEALALAMDDEPDTLVGASAAWSLGSVFHARTLSRSVFTLTWTTFKFLLLG